jgi:hypothetical protein
MVHSDAARCSSVREHSPQIRHTKGSVRQGHHSPPAAAPLHTANQNLSHVVIVHKHRRAGSAVRRATRDLSGLPAYLSDEVPSRTRGSPLPYVLREYWPRERPAPTRALARQSRQPRWAPRGPAGRSRPPIRHVSYGCTSRAVGRRWAASSDRYLARLAHARRIPQPGASTDIPDRAGAPATSTPTLGEVIPRPLDAHPSSARTATTRARRRPATPTAGLRLARRSPTRFRDLRSMSRRSGARLTAGPRVRR